MDATYVVEVSVYDPGLPGAATKYYATKGWASLSTDTPAEVHFDERLKQPLQINRTMFAPNATRGRSAVGVGDISLVNGDGELDAFTTYGVDGRSVKVYRGTIGAAYPAGWTKIFEGTMQGVEVTQEFVFLKIRDRLAELNVPMQTTKYTGGGLGTLEGTEDTLKGKPKPICYGKVLNIAPPCVETAKLIFQPADAELDSIDAVYDRGVALLPSYPPMYVAVGGEGGATDTIQTSPDGSAWTTRTSPGTVNWRQVAYGRGTWVVVGNDGGIATSTDGITWTLGTSPFTSAGDEIYAIVYGGDLFVIGGANSQIAISADGLTWTRVAGLSFGADTRGVGYGNGLYLAAAGNLFYSADAINWTIITIASQTFRATAYGDGVYVAVGFNVSSVPRIYSSTDGIAWTARTVPASHTAGEYSCVAHGNGLFVAVGTDGAGGPLIATSSDGTTWTARTSADSVALKGVVYGGATWVIVGGQNPADGSIQTSSDGTTWSAETEADAHGIQGVGYGEGGTAASYGSSADLLDNSLAPAAGKFKPFLDASGSYFRLGATPDGLVTADVTQGAAASDRTTAQIWEAILDDRGGQASGDWNATDVSDLDSANNDVIGLWTDQEMRVLDAIDLVKDSAGASSYLDAGGVFRIRQFVAPTGSAVLSITANDLIKPLRRILPAEPGQGIPQYRTILRCQKNYTPQSTDVAASVTDARRAFLAKEWREVPDTDTAVQTKHLLAIESVEETLLAVLADAATEADRRQTLRGADRQMFELWLQLNDDTESLELNDVIDLTHSRYGLSGGELCRIVGLNVNVEKRELALTVWL